MPKLLFSGTVKAGQFRPDDAPKWAGRLGKLEGRRVRVAISREQKGRTLSQNSYYWGVVLASLSEWSGHTPEEIHGALKEALLPTQQKELPNGKVLTVPGSTADLTIEDFAKYVDEVVRWAAEQGVYVPDANEVTA